jgi:peptidoglycan hydrolase-like protein with peptidoglycan-binding domain
MKIKFPLALISGVFLFSLLVSTASAATMACTNLTADLSYGQTDSNSNGPVLMLQYFLLAAGYMNAASNGHFGPATLAATMAFQSAKNISPTGYVGPLTRAAIAALSCSGTPISVLATTTTASVSSNVISPSSNILAPLVGATLPLGQTYTITWIGANRGGYSIVLEDQNGLSQGFITPNAQVSGSFNWQVGTVLSGTTNSYTTVSPGTYRIHLYTVSGNTPDLYSGAFTIAAPPLTLRSIVPQSISLSGNQTIALYGSGFNSSSRVTIDGYYNLSATILYASPDGTILVLSLPAGISAGGHVVDVSDLYGSLAVSPSFSVTQ